MGVDLIWRDSDGNELERLSDAPGWFARALNRVQNPPRANFPIMLTIDLYGDTTVIPPWTDSLAAELELVRAETAEPEVRIYLGRVLSLARAASYKSGSLLECHGD
jgi:hypothetical protein